MKLIRIVKLARVRYGDLEDGDEYRHNPDAYNPFYTPLSEKPTRVSGHEHLRPSETAMVCPSDITKYPPESVTYNIEGIDSSYFVPFSGAYAAGDCMEFVPRRAIDTQFREMEIETKYI